MSVVGIPTMKIFANSKYVSYYGHCAADFDYDCQVKIDAETIVLCYEGETGITTYRGYAIAPGHFVLKGDGFPATATLHQTPGADLLEGSWKEDGQSGMWRINLIE
jgi:hypothetical protein